MLVAVTPYHLTTREPPAMAALLLADRVLTMLPAPFEGGTQAALRAAGRSAPYRTFMETWGWSALLWERGVIVSEIGGDESAADMRVVAGRIEADEFFAPLRPFMRHSLFRDERDYLSAVAADIVKGGPDPAISVPLTAGLDRFAMRHGLLVARADPTSVAQRAEAKLGTRLFAVAVPVLLQGDAERLLTARELLAGELADLRSSLRTANQGAAQGENGTLLDPLNSAAAAYTAAFERHWDEIARGGEDDDVRPVAGTVVITAMHMPFDAVLRSSLAALAAMLGRRTLAPAGAPTTLPVRSLPGDSGWFTSLVVRPIGSTRTRRR